MRRLSIPGQLKLDVSSGVVLSEMAGINQYYCAGNRKIQYSHVRPWATIDHQFDDGGQIQPREGVVCAKYREHASNLPTRCAPSAVQAGLAPCDPCRRAVEPHVRAEDDERCPNQDLGARRIFIISHKRSMLFDPLPSQSRLFNQQGWHSELSDDCCISQTHSATWSEAKKQVIEQDVDILELSSNPPTACGAD
jgi:hypothetical protein